MSDWVVGLQTTRPFEWVLLEVFTEEDDALRYAETYMEARAGHRQSKRTWKIIDDSDDLKLLVRKH